MTVDPASQESPSDHVIQVDLDEQIAQGVYSNLVIANYSPEEFVLDYLFLQPQAKNGKVRSRIVMTPANAKRLAVMLSGLVKDYEAKFGLLSDRPLPGVRFSIN